MSMDIPDVGLALTKIFNYIHWDRATSICFVFFLLVWTCVSSLTCPRFSISLSLF